MVLIGPLPLQGFGYIGIVQFDQFGQKRCWFVGGLNTFGLGKSKCQQNKK
jgi:hypothetical protein